MRHVLKVLVCLSLATLLSACGGDSDDGDSSSSTGGTTSTAVNTTVPATSATGADSSSNGGQSATGASGSSDNGGETPHACTLLSVDEVNALLGDDADAAEGRDYLATSANATQCEWELQGGALYVEVLGTGASAWFEAVNLDNTNPPIEGLGDKAIIGAAGTLDVLQGGYMVSVQLVLPFTELDKEAVSRDVAEAVLSKLP